MEEDTEARPGRRVWPDVLQPSLLRGPSLSVTRGPALGEGPIDGEPHRVSNQRRCPGDGACHTLSLPHSGGPRTGKTGRRPSLCGDTPLCQHLSRGSSARATCSRASLVRALQRKMYRTTVNRSNTCTPQAASSSFWKRRVGEGPAGQLAGGFPEAPQPLPPTGSPFSGAPAYEFLSSEPSPSASRPKGPRVLHPTASLHLSWRGLALSQTLCPCPAGQADPRPRVGVAGTRRVPSTLAGADAFSTFRKTAVSSGSRLIFSEDRRSRQRSRRTTSVPGRAGTSLGRVAGASQQGAQDS